MKNTKIELDQKFIEPCRCCPNLKLYVETSETFAGDELIETYNLVTCSHYDACKRIAEMGMDNV